MTLKQPNNVALPKPGDILEGKVLARLRREFHVDLGRFGTGVIFGREFNEAKDQIKTLAIGDPIMVKIIDVDNELGYIEITLASSTKEKQWERVKEVKEKNEILELPIIGANKGGLVIEFEGIKGFIPVSQLSVDHYPRVEGGKKELILNHLKKLVGEKFHLKILDFNPAEEKLVFSERLAYSGELEKALSSINIGDEVEGEIVGVVDFGAFMRFGNPPLEGLIHISEIDHRLVKNPNDYLTVGDKAKAKVISIDNGRVSLSLKALQEDPWRKFAQAHKVGETVNGEVAKHNPFGAFIKISDDIQGLAHISQFGNDPEKLQKNLELGKNYEFKIELLDPAERKLGLKMANLELEEIKEKTE